jgi:hypothetical protein
MLQSTCFTVMQLFKDLTRQEEAEFRDWAKENYVPFANIKGIWHPIIQDECRRINEQAQVFG